MAEYSRLARGNFVSTGAAKAVYLPFQPQSVKLVNYTAAATPANHGIPRAYWDDQMGQGFAVVDLFNATPALIMDDVQVNGISSFAAGQLLQFGARQQVVAASKANPASFEVTGHGYSTGDVVVFQGLYSTQYTAGFPQMDGIPFTVTVTDANNFTVPWNSNQSNYTALAASPSGAYVKKVLYPDLYFPGVSYISGITVGATTTIDCANAHNLVVGQEVAFRIPSEWGTVELNSQPNALIPGSPVYGYVVSVTDYNTVVVNINSAAYTAFNSNQTVASVPGLSFPVMVAVGDVNSGGVQITSGSALYPPPYSIPASARVNTINGPGILGAFVNNTRQGFVIGAGAAVGDSSSVLVGANSDVIYWEATLYDYSE